MNTFFQKNEKRKWTWRSPYGKTKNEINFIFSKHKHLIQNVDVINQFTTGSDHRMIRCKVFINIKMERARKMEQRTPKINIESLKEGNEGYKRQLNKKFSKNPGQLNKTINEANRRITKSIKEAAEFKVKPSKKPDNKLTDKTKKTIRKKKRTHKKWKERHNRICRNQ